MNEISPLPWRLETGGKKNMSAIVDAEGKLVAGSFICEQMPITVANHRQIVEWANSGEYGKLSDGIRRAPKTWLPALFGIVLETSIKRKVWKSNSALRGIFERYIRQHSKMKETSD